MIAADPSGNYMVTSINARALPRVRNLFLMAHGNKSSIPAGVKNSVDRPVVRMLIFLGSDSLTAPKEDDHGDQEKGCEQRIISLPTPKVSCKS